MHCTRHTVPKPSQRARRIGRPGFAADGPPSDLTPHPVAVCLSLSLSLPCLSPRRPPATTPRRAAVYGSPLLARASTKALALRPLHRVGSPGEHSIRAAAPSLSLVLFPRISAGDLVLGWKWEEGVGVLVRFEVVVDLLWRIGWVLGGFCVGLGGGGEVRLGWWRFLICSCAAAIGLGCVCPLLGFFFLFFAHVVGFFGGFLAEVYCFLTERSAGMGANVLILGYLCTP